LADGRVSLLSRTHPVRREDLKKRKVAKAQRGRAATKRFSQKETKQTKKGENFAKNAEFLRIALQGRSAEEPEPMRERS
jgi:hypothetical protein